MATEKDKIKCPSCDQENGAGTKHCTDCGAELRPTASPPKDERREELINIVAEGFRKALGNIAEEKKKTAGTKKSWLDDLI